MHTRFSIPALLLAAILAGSAWGQDADELLKEYADKVAELLPGMAATEIPAREKPQQELEKLCHQAGAPGNEARREALCRVLLAAADDESPKPARVWILRKLQPLGGAEVVGGLAVLMRDSDAEIRDLARRALANNPSPQAAAAIRDELAKANDPPWQAALINALAWRRDVESVPALAKLARAKDMPVAAAAVAALSDVADDRAAGALAELRKSAPAELRPNVADASLRAADSLTRSGKGDLAAGICEELLADSQPEHIRISALTGLAAAQGNKAVPRLLEFVRGKDAHMQLIAARLLERSDKQATPAIMQAMQSSDGQVKALLLEVLGERGDSAALEAVAGQLTASDAAVRLAAIQAAGKLGNASTVPLLIERAARSQGEERDAARASVAAVRGRGVNAVVMKGLEQSDGAELVEYIYAVWGRRIAAARPKLLAWGKDAKEPVRVAALTALERIAKTEDLAALVDLLAAARDDATRKAAEEAVGSVCRRSGDADACTALLAAAMDKAPAASKPALIRLLSKYQGDAGLPALRAAAKSQDAAVKQAATAALAQWKATNITEWLVSGPYRQEGKGPQALFEIAFPPEQPRARASWKPLKAKKNDPAGTFDLAQVDKGDNCCAYVKTLIRSDRQQDVVLALGSDDGVKVWLNGTVVHGRNVTRALNCGQDQAKVTLKKGENTLLLKITQGAAQWSFCCSIRAAEGGPAEGLSFEAR